MAESSKKQKAAVETFALFRPESAIVIALTLLLTSLKFMGANWIPGQWWMWLISGIVAETILIANTVKDTQTQAQIEDDLFLQELKLERIQTKRLQAKVSKALEYHLLILQEVNANGLELTPALYDVIERMDDWILSIYRLAVKLDSYEQDDILLRDAELVPKELTSLKQSLRYEQGSMRQALEQTIATKEKQLQAITNLKSSLQSAELQMDTTLSALGTAYTQVLNLGTKTVNETDPNQLQNDIFEQIDVLEKMNLEIEKVPVPSH